MLKILLIEWEWGTATRFEKSSSAFLNFRFKTHIVRGITSVSQGLLSMIVALGFTGIA